MLEPLYCSYPILTDFHIFADLANKIKEQIEIDIQNEFHITLIYSQNPVDKNQIYNFLMNKFISWGNPIVTLNKLELFGDYLVILVDSKRLHDEFDELKNKFDCSWDFDSYQPHISLGKINPEDYSKIKLILPDVKIQTDLFKLDELIGD
jgi:hypothetical protein